MEKKAAQYGNPTLDGAECVLDEKYENGERFLKVSWSPTLLPKASMQKNAPVLIQQYDLFKKIHRLGNIRILNWMDKHARITKEPDDMLYVIAFGSDQEQTVVTHDFLKLYFASELAQFLAERFRDVSLSLQLVSLSLQMCICICLTRIRIEMIDSVASQSHNENGKEDLGKTPFGETVDSRSTTCFNS
uniref:Gamma-tubulin complex component n=1 Tax=Steinernema glaseri TaxID=37863 RepID=A0A1I7Y4M0_9BILA